MSRLELVTIPALSSSGSYEDVLINVNAVTAIGPKRNATFIDCGKTTFTTNLSIAEAIDLLAFKQRSE